MIGKPAVEATDRHRRILRAAAVCFTRSGFHGASMHDICAEASMSPGALYRYYPGKAAIIVAIAEAEREEHARMFETLDTAADPLAALRDLGVAFLRRQRDGDGDILTADVVAEAGRNPEVRAAFEKNAALAYDILCRTLQRGQNLGLVDPGLDVPAACTLLMALGDGLCAAPSVPGMDTTRLGAAMDLLLYRFCAPPTESKP